MTFELTIATASWSMTVDTAVDPAEPGPGRHLLDGLEASWATEVLPPVTQPVTARFALYDDGSAGFLDLEQGDPIRLSCRALDSTDATHRAFVLDGRISDVSASNHPRGGIVFTVIVTDRYGTDLASAGSPAVINGTVAVGTGVLNAYQQLVADEGLDLDYEWGDIVGWTLPGGGPIRDYDATNQSLADVLNLLVIHDVRQLGPGGPLYAMNVIQALDDITDTAPQPDAAFELVPYQPYDVRGLDSILELAWTGSLWVTQPNADYYDTESGMLLYADQLLADVGEWRKSRPAAINRIELTGDFQNGGNVQTIRRGFTDLVTAYGANTRSVSSPLRDKDDARDLGDFLLGDRSQVQSGYGLSTATVLVDRLSDAQLSEWLSEMWPMDHQQAMGKPFAIAGIPDHWRLVSGPAVFGRLMGVTYTINKRSLRAQLAMRAVPASLDSGVTWAELVPLDPDPTWDTLDPSITWEQLSMVTA